MIHLPSAINEIFRWWYPFLLPWNFKKIVWLEIIKISTLGKVGVLNVPFSKGYQELTMKLFKKSSVIEHALWQVLQFFPVFFLFSASLIWKFIHKFCEFMTNILAAGICQHISECWAATGSVSPFGIRNALSQTPQNPHIRLRNLFNMQMWFFSLHSETSYFCKTNIKLFFLDVQLVGRIRAFGVFAERRLQALVQSPHHDPGVHLQVILKYHLELCMPPKSF